MPEISRPASNVCWVQEKCTRTKIGLPTCPTFGRKHSYLLFISCQASRTSTSDILNRLYLCFSPRTSLHHGNAVMQVKPFTGELHHTHTHTNEQPQRASFGWRRLCSLLIRRLFTRFARDSSTLSRTRAHRCTQHRGTPMHPGGFGRVLSKCYNERGPWRVNA